MCCGRSTKPTPRIPATRSPPVAPRPSAWFEYRGATALTIVSPRTGATYRFPAPGARAAVDPRDSSWLAFVPNLARLA